jgi:hypothetical protein
MEVDGKLEEFAVSIVILSLNWTGGVYIRRWRKQDS